jgi:UDP-N-acetylglucosamine 1-carboxyvinyltransferase
MPKLVIQGKKRIFGVHKVPGNKNAALPMIAATLLTDEAVVLENVPDIADVSSMLEAAKTFGAKVTRDRENGRVTLQTKKIKSAKIDPALAQRIRTSFLFAGPLLARVERASLPPPGGDAIGHRRLDTHFAGFKALGAKAVRTKKTLF